MDSPRILFPLCVFGQNGSFLWTIGFGFTTAGGFFLLHVKDRITVCRARDWKRHTWTYGVVEPSTTRKEIKKLPGSNSPLFGIESVKCNVIVLGKRKKEAKLTCYVTP